MKCGVCGGELYFEGEIAICQNCKSQHKIDNIFENIEVCICYIEIDEISKDVYDDLLEKNASVYEDYRAF